MAEEAINYWVVRYADFEIDTDNEENISALGQNSISSRKHHFPVFDETFDEVIYPKGDPDAVSISKRDIELLQPETFINDTIIDFYIKYLKNKIPADEQHKFHFFNCFFFRKLVDLQKDQSSACDGRAAFQRVRKWTRKVRLFEKDYIFVPINYNFPWSLIVLCHPGEVTCLKDEEVEESTKVPCILHMDSLRGSHEGLRNVFQSYLCEEWKERHKYVVDDVCSKLLHLRFVSLELPQQENSYDCGLFLLHYVELFLKEALISFSPFQIIKFSDFLTTNWFPPAEASFKRVHIQKLIYDIFEDSSLKAPAHGNGGRCHLTIWHESPSTSSTAEEKTDILFPATCPVRVTSCFREPGLVFNDLQGAIVTSSSANCLQMEDSYQRGFMSPIEETEEGAKEASESLLWWKILKP